MASWTAGRPGPSFGCTMLGNSWAMACMSPAGGALEEGAAPGSAGASAAASASCQPSAGAG
eukprot:12804024-Alexandrium_andersonii.AAC.1